MARQYQIAGQYVIESGTPRQFQTVAGYIDGTSAGSIGGELKSSIGVLLANIKTVHATAIASVKTYDRLTV